MSTEIASGSAHPHSRPRPPSTPSPFALSCGKADGNDYQCPRAIPSRDTMAGQARALFEDFCDVKELNPGGKPFDKGM